MSKSGGVFQFSGGRMTSRGQCSRGVCVVCVLVNVFTPPPPLRKSCRPIRACNMPSRSVEIKQPPQRRPKLAIHCRVPPSLYCRVSPCLLLGPAVSTVSLQSTNTQAHQAAYLADSVPDTMTLHEPARSIQASNLSDTCRQAESV